VDPASLGFDDDHARLVALYQQIERSVSALPRGRPARFSISR
jgi:hypothetical protein